MPRACTRCIRTLATFNTNPNTNNRPAAANAATDNSTPTGATIDSTSRRRTRSSNSGGGDNSDVTGESNSSICDSARINSITTGNHDGRFYNVNYFRDRSQPTYPNCEGDGACGNRAQCDVCDRERICICRYYRIPIKCNDCELSAIPQEICSFHRVITCTNDGCDACYHVGCIASSQHLTLQENNTRNLATTFICYRCINTNDSTIDSTWSTLGVRGNDERIKRCGMPSVTTRITRSAYVKKIKAAGAAFSTIQHKNNNPVPIKLLDTTPRPFSSMVHMEAEAKEKHALLG